MLPLGAVPILQAAGNGRRIQSRKDSSASAACCPVTNNAELDNFAKEQGAESGPLRQKQNLRWCRDLPKRFLTVRENDAVLRPLVAASTTALHNDRAIVDVICVVRVLRHQRRQYRRLLPCALKLERCDFSSDSAFAIFRGWEPIFSPGMSDSSFAATRSASDRSGLCSPHCRGRSAPLVTLCGLLWSFL